MLVATRSRERLVSRLSRQITIRTVPMAGVAIACALGVTWVLGTRVSTPMMIMTDSELEGALAVGIDLPKLSTLKAEVGVSGMLSTLAKTCDAQLSGLFCMTELHVGAMG